MAVDFETPTVALFARLASLPGIVYSTRILESWDDLPDSSTPALMLTSDDIEEYAAGGSAGMLAQTPPLWKVKLTAVLYIHSTDPQAVPPSTDLNRFIALVCNALLRQPTEPLAPSPHFVNVPPGSRGTTLGGLCASCKVGSRIIRAEGLVGHTAVAEIPIEMVVTS